MSKDYFKQIYFEALDIIISAVKDCFEQPSYKSFLQLESFLLKAINGENFETELNFIKEMY